MITVELAGTLDHFGLGFAIDTVRNRATGELGVALQISFMFFYARFIFSRG